MNGFSNWKMSGLSIFLVLAIMAGVLGYVDTETYISDLDKPGEPKLIFNLVELSKYLDRSSVLVFPCVNCTP